MPKFDHFKMLCRTLTFTRRKKLCCTSSLEGFHRDVFLGASGDFGTVRALKMRDNFSKILIVLSSKIK